LDISRTAWTPKKLDNRGRNLVAAEIGLETELLIGLDCIGALILQFVRAQFVEQTNAATLLVLVDQQAAALSRDRVERELELRAAVATQAVKHVAGQALGVNPH